jgi:hypothetical protein
MEIQLDKILCLLAQFNTHTCMHVCMYCVIKFISMMENAIDTPS